MYSEQKYEKSKISDKLKELATLSIFTISVTIICIIVMDILIYPITIFAIRQKPLFNLIIKNTIIYILPALIIYLMIKKIYKLNKEVIDKKELRKILTIKPVLYIITVLIFLLSSAAVIAVLYLLLSKNYYLIHYFSNS